MQIRTNKNRCPQCDADRLAYTASLDLESLVVEYPCSCDVCGWEGFELYKDNKFIGHTSAAGVVRGYF